MLPDDHFFRRESGRLTATLTRALGVHNLALAEDAVQETLASAVEVWAFRGVPDNPQAWLMTAARNRAVSLLRREQTARKFAPEIGRRLDEEEDAEPGSRASFLPPAMQDDELRMMFSCANPAIAEEAQVALILYLLCGFSVEEVASAFLVSRPAMEKRIFRAKKVLASSDTLFELSADDFGSRLGAVHRALYLLFSEGYHGASADSVVREDLCREAMRLVHLLVEHAPAATPATLALAALMSLHAARLSSRIDEGGELTALVDQDRSRWNAQMIARGLELLEASARGDQLSEYHLEAGIAAMHATSPSPAATRWREIVSLYDSLLRLRPSPVIALNRAVAVGELEGPRAGVEALRAIQGAERLASYPFYPAALGEMELRSGNPAEARERFSAAHRLARNAAERSFLEQRIAECERRVAAGKIPAASR